MRISRKEAKKWALRTQAACAVLLLGAAAVLAMPGAGEISTDVEVKPKTEDPAQLIGTQSEPLDLAAATDVLRVFNGYQEPPPAPAADETAKTAETPTEEATPENHDAAPGQPTWRYLGWVRNGEMVKALVSITNPETGLARQQLIGLGGEYDGWKLEQVDAGQIRISKDGDSRQVALAEPTVEWSQDAPSRVAQTAITPTVPAATPTATNQGNAEEIRRRQMEEIEKRRAEADRRRQEIEAKRKGLAGNK